MSDATLLSAIDTAIEAIITGQVASYSLDGVSYTFHDIDKLYSLKRSMESRVNAAAGTGFKIQTVSFENG